MVKLQIMSDLHIETMQGDLLVTDFITPSAKILVLAGDIGRIHKYEQLSNFLKQLCPLFEVVIYVLGNHEFYRVDGVKPKTIPELLEDLEKIRKEIPNLYVLNRDSIIIEDVCIAGCTLWTKSVINVPPFIVRVHEMNTVKYNAMNEADVNYIEDMIKYCSQKKLKLVMVTHHCPTFSMNSTKKNNHYACLYHNNLDRLMSIDKVHTWIFGHIHKNTDHKTKRGTRLVTNQKGKPKDKVIDFVKNKVILV